MKATPEKVSETTPKFVFARHETFHPRFGWIKKGFDAAVSNPHIFSEPDPHIVLGVGKNMSSAIRYWCTAYKVLGERTGPTTSTRTLVPTEFGQRLLGESGWDPYLDDPSSLWLLHWNLVKTPSSATAWREFFTTFRALEFQVEDLTRHLTQFCERNNISLATSSLQKDVNCWLRMFVEQPQKNTLDEDSLDCPFTELGLVRALGDARYGFVVGDKSTLQPEIIAAVCLEYAAQVGPEQRTISVWRLLYGEGSPGQVFKLTESAIYSAIESVAETYPDLKLSDSAGLVQLAFLKDPGSLSQQILDGYYSEK